MELISNKFAPPHGESNGYDHNSYLGGGLYTPAWGGWTSRGHYKTHFATDVTKTKFTDQKLQL